jgi:hypothetical protein
MTQINPFTGSILQSPTVQRQQSAEKDRQVRRTQDMEKNAALPGDHLEHQVESSDALSPIHDEDSPDPRKRKRPGHGNKASTKNDPQDPSHLDLTA